jgi:thiol:disulfide interchange protein DsbC
VNSLKTALAALAMLFSLLAACTSSASPDASKVNIAAGKSELAVKAEVEKKFPEVKVESVTKTGYAGMYEVFVGSEIFYTDDKVTFLMLGKVVDTQTRTDVTEARLAKLTAIKFDDLPLDKAIKLVRGTGARRIAIFEDPNCGYCKKFEADLNATENITAFIFPYPILAPDSMDKSKAIWCAPDRLKAWQDQMLRGQLPATIGACETPIDQLVAVGQKLRVRSIPTMFFEDGLRISGAIPREELEAKLVAAMTTPVKAETKAAVK